MPGSKYDHDDNDCVQQIWQVVLDLSGVGVAQVEDQHGSGAADGALRSLLHRRRSAGPT